MRLGQSKHSHLVLVLVLIGLVVLLASQMLAKGRVVEGQINSPATATTPLPGGSPVAMGTPLSPIVATTMPLVNPTVPSVYPTATFDLTSRFPPTTTPEPNIHAPGSVPFPRPRDDSNEPHQAPNEWSTDRRDCSDFDTIEEAARYVYPNDPNHLDQDGDGVPCEGVLPHSYELTVTTTPRGVLQDPAEQSTRPPLSLPTFEPRPTSLPTFPPRPMGLPTFEGDDEECPLSDLSCF